ncbi:MAG: VanZ family protein [Proteobacteria bacterium]|nr:VanZ family protein [Desulfobacteraceae bacterium]MBU3979699.1 VanZ family protein [Pseudomonadota bacterium]MBU4013735.1 VanZ family protein [Pseudomonadota bacterium]MBU4068711.1 VanZ family protein [Pseudomonadota bacterium]MBU4101518.1 VanZ family protein [Pseudomonadota bacterium]
MGAAGPFSLYGAASLKNMLQKIRRVRYHSEGEGRLPAGDINFLPPASLKAQRSQRENNISKSTKVFKKFIYYWLPILIYCFLIFIQSSYPSPESIPALPYIDKILHFIAYAVLGVLFFRAYRTQRFKENINLAIMLSIISSSLYGLSDEVHQYFVPSRNADIMDFFADVAGSICGVYIFNRFLLKIPIRSKK